MFEEINKARNKFYAKLIKIAASTEKKDKEIIEMLEAHDEFINKILKFKCVYEDTLNGKNISDLPHVAKKFQ